MNGARVWDLGDAVMLPLPRELWRETECSCDHCALNGGIGYWDTLAIPIGEALETNPHAWTVHGPEYQLENVYCQCARCVGGRRDRLAERDERRERAAKRRG